MGQPTNYFIDVRLHGPSGQKLAILPQRGQNHIENFDYTCSKSCISKEEKSYYMVSRRSKDYWGQLKLVASKPQEYQWEWEWR